MKKRIMVLALLVICISIAAYGTLAYFTYEDTATNIITAGNLKIELINTSAAADGTSVPAEDVYDVMPGTDVSRVVSVKNVGGHAAWVRVAVDRTILLADGVTGEVDPGLVELDINMADWSERDGYYYYNRPLYPGVTTEPIFTVITFSTSMGNMYQHSTAVVAVDAQATQVANNGGSVFDAAGWPKAD